MDNMLSKFIPTDDQSFLLYFIMGTYFAPDLKEETPHKSVLQRRVERVPEYDRNQLSGSYIRTIDIESVYYYLLRKADYSVIVPLSCLKQFLKGSIQLLEPYVSFADLFSLELHPRLRVENQHDAFENIVLINDPNILYIDTADIERFKSLTRLHGFVLDLEHPFLKGLWSTEPLYYTTLPDAVFPENLLCCDQVQPFNVNTKIGTGTSSENEYENKMMYLPSCPSKEQWDSKFEANNGGIFMTGSVATGRIGPILGLIDIGECDDSYLFRVSLPGVKRDEREFSCEVEYGGKVMIKGVTETEEKTVNRHSQVFIMQSQSLCPPGHFSISFKLPGPVNPQQFSGVFGTDGIFEGLVLKQEPKKSGEFGRFYSNSGGFGRFTTQADLDGLYRG